MRTLVVEGRGGIVDRFRRLGRFNRVIGLKNAGRR